MGLSEVDQFVFLRAAFPEVPADLLQRACARPRHDSLRDWSKLPWNRRLRRSVERARPGSVLLNFSPKQPGWKGMGRVVQVPDSDKGLGSGLVVQQLLRWAASGVIGGVICGEEVFGGGSSDSQEAKDSGVFSWDSHGISERLKTEFEEGSVKGLRVMLIAAVAQAAKDRICGVKVDSASSPLGSGLRSGDEDIPSSGNPGDLALWALKRAAAELESNVGTRERSSEPIFMLFEQPRDLRNGGRALLGS